MSQNSRNISKDNISLGVIKALSRANTNKKDIIAEILNNFDIEPFFDISYRSIDYSSESLIKSMLFMKLKGLNQSNLETHLKTHKNERKKLGLKRAPDQSMISYFNGKKLTSFDRHKITTIVERIEEIAAKKNIILDSLKLKKKNKKKRNKKTSTYNRKMKSHKIAKLFKKRILPFIYFHLKQNCCYRKINFVDLLVYLTREMECSEEGADTYRLDLKKIGANCPNCGTKMISDIDLWDKGKMSLEIGDNYFLCPDCGKKKKILPVGGTLRHQIKNFKDENEIMKMFIRAFAKLWSMLPESIDFKKKPVTIAIDITRWLFWGKKDNKYIVGGKRKSGTNYSYKFMTIDIVQPGKRFTLLALPVTQLSDRVKLLAELLEFARKRVKIGLVLLDREFFNVADQKLLRDFRLKYIMPCTAYYNIKKITENNPAPFVLEGVPMGKNEISYTMAAVKRLNNNGVEEIHGFATNTSVNTDKPDTEAKRIADLYKSRWGIETGYRVKTHTFRPRTSSKDYRIRIFYFYFSILMYNLWIIADIYLWLEESNKVGEKHLITAKYFRKQFSLLDPGG